MAKYLIVECEELGDSWECDADRRPLFITEDEQVKREYMKKKGYEIYQADNEGKLELVKEYDEKQITDEEGMALYYWNNDAYDGWPPVVIKKYKNSNQYGPVPREVCEILEKVDTDEYGGTGYDIGALRECGYMDGWTILGDGTKRYYVYGRYEDDSYTIGY